jgi:hypothetical protein
VTALAGAKHISLQFRLQTMSAASVTLRHVPRSNGAWELGVVEYRSHGDHEVMKWALRSARQLERLLESL